MSKITTENPGKRVKSVTSFPTNFNSYPEEQTPTEITRLPDTQIPKHSKISLPPIRHPNALEALRGRTFEHRQRVGRTTAGGGLELDVLAHLLSVFVPEGGGHDERAKVVREAE